MPTELELAILAHQAYAFSPQNDLEPTISSWGVPLMPIDSQSSGFSAVAFKRGSELVVAFRGTDYPQGADWQNANVPAARGYYSQQVMDAIMYVADVVAAYGGDDPAITFTGHSLGGGLASLMAVFFDKDAKVVDPAPFRRSAESVSPAEGASYEPTDLVWEYFEKYRRYQESISGRTVSEAFRSYAATFHGSSLSAEQALLAQREQRVAGSYVEGEPLAIARLPANLRRKRRFCKRVPNARVSTRTNAERGIATAPEFGKHRGGARK